jgi:aminoglycoside phosphotransferase (APT) family kinase protein
MDKTLENASFEKALRQMKSRPLTLTHGDFHAKNLFLTKEKDIIFTDFCEVGLGDPISDLV